MVNDNHKPNIIFVFADQLRADVLECYGDRQACTPHIIKLASEGILFTNAIANSPVCGPSRASLLTGKYPLRHKVLVNDFQLNPDHETIATELKEHGYKTGYIGKWHLDGMPRDKFTPPGPRRLGFDDYWAVYNCAHEYFDTKYYLDTPELITNNEYEPIHQTDLAFECMEQWRNDNQPFCLFLSWGPPHDPYDQVPEKYKNIYDAKIEARVNCPNPDHEVIRNYYAAVTALDDQLGRLLHYLNQNGMEENTIFVFSSDHGDMLGSHGYSQKQLPFEESIHIPLIIRWKNHLKQAVCEDIIGIADFAPTLLGMIGIDRPSDMQGTDLSERLLSGKGSKHESLPIMNIVPKGNALKYGVKHPWRGVRTEQYTYACYQDQAWILYDNTKDPYQLSNLANDSSYRDIQEALDKELKRWLVLLEDEFLTGEEHLAKLGLKEK